jgi:dihydropteroate synthase-like protein
LKVLLVTGQLAEEIVYNFAKKSHIEFKVLSLPIPVAALLTPQYIARMLIQISLSGFDIILVPGLVIGDVSIIEEKTGIQTFKGPKYAADIPIVLKNLDRFILSKSIPACKLMDTILNGEAQKEIKQVEENRKCLIRKPGNMVIGNLVFGKDFPMRVVAEIVDSPLLSDEEIIKKTRYYAQSGANIIDIGMMAGKSFPDKAARAVKLVQKTVNLPISIDTLDPIEAKAAVISGANMIMSADGNNLDSIYKFARECVIVIIPTDHGKGLYPKEAEERVFLLEKNIEKAKKLGLKKLVGDLILDPIGNHGVTESIASYHLFSRRNPNVPLFFGIANVVELLDADSIGANALLCGIASELRISMILATEASNKTLGSVKELSTAAKMMYISKKRNAAPKDLGFDLLCLKEKRKHDDPYNEGLWNKISHIEVEEIEEFQRDNKGYFKIMINRKNNKILVAYNKLNCSEPNFLVSGSNASNIYKKITAMGLISKIEHASYLGAELAKAEIAMKLNRSYIQDTELF